MSEHIYVACPYCGHSIVDSKFRHTNFNIDPLEFLIFTKREQRSDSGYRKGQGKGHRGFFMVEGSGKTIIELAEGSLEEREIAQRIVKRIKTIYEAYREAGLL